MDFSLDLELLEAQEESCFPETDFESPAELAISPTGYFQDFDKKSEDDQFAAFKKGMNNLKQNHYASKGEDDDKWTPAR